MLNDLFTLSASLPWRSTPWDAIKLAESLLPQALAAHKYLAAPDPWLPVLEAIWLNPESKVAYAQLSRVRSGPHAGFERLERGQVLNEKLGAVEVVFTDNPGQDPLAVRIASVPAPPVLQKQSTTHEALFDYLASTGLLEASEGLSKLAQYADYSPAMRGLGEVAGYLPGGALSWEETGLPRHLQGMLGGGLLGATLGYGAGMLGEQVLPASWDKRKIRRNGMLLGAAAGTLPGAAAMLAEAGTGQKGLASAIFDSKPPLVSTSGLSAKSGSIAEAAAAIHVELHPVIKAATSQTGVNELDFTPMYVPADHFSQIIWGDPRVAGQLSLPERAAASGLVQVAQQHRQQLTGDDSGLVYPGDIARIAAGMGSGYLSGAIVGKVLGELIGLPEQTQDRLKNTGMWAGVVKSVLPLIFGR